jgi:hypothetical protein
MGPYSTSNSQNCTQNVSDFWLEVSCGNVVMGDLESLHAVRSCHITPQGILGKLVLKLPMQS